MTQHWIAPRGCQFTGEQRRECSPDGVPRDDYIPRLVAAICHERGQHLQQPELHRVVGAVEAAMYL